MHSPTAAGPSDWQPRRPVVRGARADQAAFILAVARLCGRCSRGRFLALRRGARTGRRTRLRRGGDVACGRVCRRPENRADQPRGAEGHPRACREITAPPSAFRARRATSLDALMQVGGTGWQLRFAFHDIGRKIGERGGRLMGLPRPAGRAHRPAAAVRGVELLRNDGRLRLSLSPPSGRSPLPYLSGHETPVHSHAGWPCSRVVRPCSKVCSAGNTCSSSCWW